MPLPLLHYAYSSKVSKYNYASPKGEAPWALITGASDGIGRSLCFALSAQGFNIVLHGRNASKLSNVIKDLEVRFPNCSYQSLIIDASTFTPEDIAGALEQLETLHLTILINNAGGTAPLSTNFKLIEDTTDAEIQAITKLNYIFPLRLTAALLPTFKARKQPSLITMCGSSSAIGMAYISSYSPTKGAIHSFARALGAELVSEGYPQIEVLEAIIGPTYTQVFQGDEKFKPGLFMPTADVMAENIVRRMGHGNRLTTAYFWHALQDFSLYGLMPASVADAYIASMLKPSVWRP